MKKLILAAILAITITVLNVNVADAVVDPLASQNNKFGIHILFPSEIDDASRLVNSTGGDWGYVTIPIQAGDRDLEKWQKFMDKAASLHLIPIIRLATAGDYFQTKFWQKPTEEDVVDFANFLNSLDWPIKNRYIVVFNEPNRNDEWGGSSSPQEYAQILDFAASAFKSRNQDFFIISAGLDNAAQNSKESINEYTFLKRMSDENPNIFSAIDGFASHAYPNPGFSQSPRSNSLTGVASFRYERDMIYGLSGRILPVFITETGWSKNKISDNVSASFYKDAFTNVWSDNGIVAVTPFLFSAQAEPFLQFSFLDKNNNPNEEYKSFQAIPKNKGQPALPGKLLVQDNQNLQEENLTKKRFLHEDSSNVSTIYASELNIIKSFMKWLFRN
ncbi:MAG: hypothetical protein Q7R31_03520 [Candidatus Levybacteria bacterium]|nr:hypothetical protein [Candidatus Levybacteria bacterium]